MRGARLDEESMEVYRYKSGQFSPREVAKLLLTEHNTPSPLGLPPFLLPTLVAAYCKAVMAGKAVGSNPDCRYFLSV